MKFAVAYWQKAIVSDRASWLQECRESTTHKGVKLYGEFTAEEMGEFLSGKCHVSRTALNVSCWRISGTIFKNAVPKLRIPAVSTYIVRLYNALKVLLPDSWEVPFGWCSELRLPYSPGTYYTEVATFRKTFHRTQVWDRQCHSVDSIDIQYYSLMRKGSFANHWPGSGFSQPVFWCNAVHINLCTRLSKKCLLGCVNSPLR